MKMDDFAIRTAIRSAVTAVIVNLTALAVEQLASPVWSWVIFAVQMLGNVTLTGYLWWGTAAPLPESPSTARTLYRAAQRRRELRR